MKEQEYCNCCAKKLQTDMTGSRPEEALFIQKEWGYFSGKDLEIHRIVLCEECYDQWIKTFKIPVRIEIKQEV